MYSLDVLSLRTYSHTLNLQVADDDGADAAGAGGDDEEGGDRVAEDVYEVDVEEWVEEARALVRSLAQVCGSCVTYMLCLSL